MFFVYAEFFKTHPHRRDLEELPLRLHAILSHPLGGKYFITLLHSEVFEGKYEVLTNLLYFFSKLRQGDPGTSTIYEGGSGEDLKSLVRKSKGMISIM